MNKWKLVILDMDGTLYDIHDVVGMNYRIVVEFYSTECGLSEAGAEKILAENFILSHVSDKERSATEFFSKSGLDLFKWQAFRTQHFDVEKIDLHKVSDPQLIREFREHGMLVLLTSNSFCNTQKILERIRITTDDFDSVVCSDHNYPYAIFDKRKAMTNIMEHFDVEPAECISIGDRFQTDVAPMLDIGGAGIQIKTPKALKHVIQFLYGPLKNTDTKMFTFYPSISSRREN